MIRPRALRLNFEECPENYRGTGPYGLDQNIAFHAEAIDPSKAFTLKGRTS